VRLPSGKLKPVKVGDEIKKGEEIVTDKNGGLEITPAKGKPVKVEPQKDKPVLAEGNDLDQTLAAIERGDEEAAAAAGLAGGEGGGGLRPGLRVDRVQEDVTPQSFTYSTDRGNFEVPENGTLEDELFAAQNPLDDAAVQAISPATALEGQGLVFTVTLDRTTTAPTVLNLQLNSGTATVGADTSAPIEVSFDNGVTFQTIALDGDQSAAVLVPVGAGTVLVRVPTVADGVTAKVPRA